MIPSRFSTMVEDVTIFVQFHLYAKSSTVSETEARDPTEIE